MPIPLGHNDRRVGIRCKMYIIANVKMKVRHPVVNRLIFPGMLNNAMCLNVERFNRGSRLFSDYHAENMENRYIVQPINLNRSHNVQINF